MKRLNVETKNLIKPKDALKILTFVSRAGLYSGARGTDYLTLFYDANGRRLYSREECEELVKRYIEKGESLRDKIDGAEPYVDKLV